MSIQLLGDLILLRSGSIATNADCCCNEPCIECLPCPTCWSSELAPCNTLDSFDITISGVVSRAYGSCSCSSANATYSYDITTHKCNGTGWQVFENCVLNTLVRYSLRVDAALRFSTSDIPITTQSELNSRISPAGGLLCNAYTIKKGHYIEVNVTETFRTLFPASSLSYLIHRFFYSFDNHDIKPGCPDDQSYGLCTGLSSGGNATYVYSQIYSTGRYSAPPSCFFDFGFSNHCDLSSMVIQIGAVQVSVTP